MPEFRHGLTLGSRSPAITDRGSAARRHFHGSRLTSSLVNALRAAENSEKRRHTNT